jgi:hypothetical protein
VLSKIPAAAVDPGQGDLPARRAWDHATLNATRSSKDILTGEGTILP